MILWADSFDHYGTVNANMTDGAYAESSGTISGTQARTGSKSYRCTGNTLIRRVFGGPLVTVGVAGAFFFATLPVIDNVSPPLTFCDASNTPQVTITVDTTGVISVWRGNGSGSKFTTKLGDSGVPAITANAWNSIEAKVKIANSGGTVEVRVNGVTVINLTGQDTQASGAAETSQVRWEVTGAGTEGYYVDDVVAWDTTGALNNDFLGDRKVVTDFPNADTADVAWTRSTGSTNFGVIDENPPNGDTDYLTTTNNGDKAGVTFPNLPTEVTQISAVVFIQKTKKTDAGTANTQLHLKSGASTANGTDRPMTTAYTLYHDVFETDPATSAPFTRSAAQAASWTIERTA